MTKKITPVECVDCSYRIIKKERSLPDEVASTFRVIEYGKNIVEACMDDIEFPYKITEKYLEHRFGFSDAVKAIRWYGDEIELVEQVA